MGAAAPFVASPVPRDVVRTCVGCRSRASAAELLRVVADPAEPSGAIRVVRPDPGRRAPGRGAWVHPDQRCVAQAERRRAFGRALRVPPGTDCSAVVQYIDALLI